jgi:hypothetical protein
MMDDGLRYPERRILSWLHFHLCHCKVNSIHPNPAPVEEFAWDNRFDIKNVGRPTVEDFAAGQVKLVVGSCQRRCAFMKRRFFLAIYGPPKNPFAKHMRAALREDSKTLSGRSIVVDFYIHLGI